MPLRKEDQRMLKKALPYRMPTRCTLWSLIPEAASSSLAGADLSFRPLRRELPVSTRPLLSGGLHTGAMLGASA
eukprot:8484596-Pyramimonas_sp.AAC.1